MITNLSGFQGEASLDRGRVTFGAYWGGRMNVYLAGLFLNGHKVVNQQGCTGKEGEETKDGPFTKGRNSPL
jgi:hypothetical protein